MAYFAEAQSASPESPNNDRWRRIIASVAVIVVATGIGVHFINNSGNGQLRDTTTQAGQYDSFLKQTGDSLISLHQESDGGWRFQSQIQAPHFQTDRDVGAASVGEGFLKESDAFPKDKKWIEAAKHTADWLIAVSNKDNNGGRYWNDYVDSNNRSSDVYTSFDDGTIGIGDYLWRVYEKTGDIKYKKAYLESLQWTFSRAEPYNQDGLQAYHWKWNVNDESSPYYMGMGEGTVGIAYELAESYQRLQNSDPKVAVDCKKYLQGALNYIDIIEQNLAKDIGTGRALPETGVIGRDGDTGLNSGYLSGSAGAAFLYLKLHQIFGDKTYLDRAEKYLGWLNDPKNGPLVNVAFDQVAWRLELDPQGDNNNRYATGVEEGSTGIGWVELQAYGQTGNKMYLKLAEKAGNYLLGVAQKDGQGGLYWHEDEHPASQNAPHVNLNNGAAGVGQFLEDLANAAPDKQSKQKYQAGAKGAMQWIMNTAKHKGKYIYWTDNSGNTFSGDPSWHWGESGEIGDGVRMNTKHPTPEEDTIGEQPGIPSKLLYKK